MGEVRRREIHRGDVGARGRAGRPLTGSEAPATPGRARLFVRGLTLACPVCGRRGLFRRWFVMTPRCPRCRFRFEREEGHWVGSLGLNTVISFGALLLTIVVGVVATAPDVAVGPLTIAAVSVALVVPLAVFPLSRTLWSAVDLMMRPLERGDFENGN